MARTREGAQLTEQHRQAQATLAASLVETIRNLLLDTLNLADIDGSSREFTRQALPLVLAHREVSRAAAQRYLERFRTVELRELVDHEDLAEAAGVDLEEAEQWVSADAIELGDDDDYLDDPETVARELYSASANVAKAEKGRAKSDGQARKRAADTAAATAMRQVSDGARAPVRREVEHGNHGAGGYFRVVDADPCPFCAMLASRGPMYNLHSFEDSDTLFSGDGQFKVHDGCGCSLEPIYGRKGAGLPQINRDLAEQWARIASGREDPWNSWRRYKRSGTIPDDETDPQTGTGGSAPQYGRDRGKAERKAKGTPSRKPIDQLNEAELVRAVNAMELRRKGMRKELAKLEQRGCSPDEQGPAQSIAVRLKRLDKQIAEGNRRMGILGVT